jgi:hypothetical protein
MASDDEIDWISLEEEKEQAPSTYEAMLAATRGALGAPQAKKLNQPRALLSLEVSIVHFAHTHTLSAGVNSMNLDEIGWR